MLRLALIVTSTHSNFGDIEFLQLTVSGYAAVSCATSELRTYRTVGSSGH